MQEMANLSSKAECWLQEMEQVRTLLIRAERNDYPWVIGNIPSAKLPPFVLEGGALESWVRENWL